MDDKILVENVRTFIMQLKKGHIGNHGMTPKLCALVEHFDKYQEQIGTNRTWLELYQELAMILESALESPYFYIPSFIVPMSNVLRSDCTTIIGKMNDDGTYNSPYRIHK